MLTDIEQPGVGRLVHMNTPFLASDLEVDIHGCAPRRGEHALEILTSLLRMTPQQVAAILVDGTIDAEESVAAGIYAHLS
jgi:hypothetical protein